MINWSEKIGKIQPALLAVQHTRHQAFGVAQNGLKLTACAYRSSPVNTGLKI